MSKKTASRSKQQQTSVTSTWNAGFQERSGDRLTRDRIVAAGIAIADVDGLSAVSIRRVASRLDSSPMALYHYVPSKRDLLNLMLDACYAEFAWPAQKMTDWRAVLSHFAWESRRCLKQHPWVSLLQTSDPEYGPECIRMLESLLAGLSQFDLDVRAAIRIIGVLFVFVNGFVAAECSYPATDKSKKAKRAASQPTFSKAILASGDYPHVQKLVDTGAELPDDEGFARALDWILNGIGTEIKLPLRGRQKQRA